MTAKEKDAFFKVLKDIKLPDEYSLAIRGSLPKRVASIIIELCHLFKCLCAKVLKESDLDELKSQSAMILCEMEKIFPPSFFTMMVHLIMHLAEKVKLGGAVAYRWMYPIERYLEGVETRCNRPLRYDDEDDIEHSNEGVLRIKLDSQSLLQAHRYIFFNTYEVTPFIEQHKDFLKKQHRSLRLSQFQIERHHSLTFHEWFHDRVTRMEQQGYAIFQKIKWLSKEPSDVALTYSGYLVNGLRFHTKTHEKNLKTQNSGVAVI
ncbi:hypothetical protein SLEP1_g3722 [Rubroshorea leprosula]|uniref:DUF4218 domain-containing protein n=1 Tax=Rubroshorea leprosula TaxID=152421 RepID=A0AAV5HUI4_9ROSI|nr:hypothetical protein SLEP1_g3722 [Rubroshorea leprosula]